MSVGGAVLFFIIPSILLIREKSKPGIHLEKIGRKKVYSLDNKLSPSLDSISSNFTIRPLMSKPGLHLKGQKIALDNKLSPSLHSKFPTRPFVTKASKQFLYCSRFYEKAYPNA